MHGRTWPCSVGENDRAVRRVDALLSLEFGGENDTFSAAEMLAAIEDPAKSINKQGLKLIKDKASEHLGVSYLIAGRCAPRYSRF